MSWAQIKAAILAELRVMGVIETQSRDDARPPTMLRNGTQIVIRVTGSKALGNGWDGLEEVTDEAGEVLEAYPTHTNHEHVTISIRFEDAHDPDRALDSIHYIRTRMRRRRFVDAILAAGGGVVSIGDVTPASFNYQKREVAAYAFPIVVSVEIVDREEDNTREWIESFGFTSDELPTGETETIVPLPESE